MKIIFILLSLSVMAVQAQPLKTKLIKTIKTQKPAFLFLEKNNEGVLDLLITSFKVFGNDSIKAVRNIQNQLRNIDNIEPEIWSSSIKWPNELKTVPSEIFGENFYSVAGGFLVPGKSNGAITIINPNTKKEFEITSAKRGWWYHQVEWLDMNNDGKLDIVTARAQKGMFGGTGGELIWLEQPENPFSKWKEHLIWRGGPDVFFRLTDLNHDNEIEILATEFFAKNFSILWKENDTWVRKVIDSTIGSAFSLQLVDVNNDGKIDVLATNHESETEKAAVFAYEIPENIFAEKWTRHTLLTNIPTLQKGIGQASPGEAHAFHPFTDSAGKPCIMVSGDGSQKAHILIPKSESSNNWEYEEQILVHTYSTVGRVAVGDVDENGVSEVFVPAYDADEIYIYTFEK